MPFCTYLLAKCNFCQYICFPSSTKLDSHQFRQILFPINVLPSKISSPNFLLLFLSFNAASNTFAKSLATHLCYISI